MTDYTARLLTVEDGTAWHALLVEGTRDFPLGFLVSAEEALAMDEGRIAAAMARGTMYGVFDGAEMVGLAGLSRGGTKRIGHRGMVGPFYVTPKAQGTAAADVLMTALKAAARAGGMTQMILWVDTQNGRAVRFYERHSLSVVGMVKGATMLEDGSARDDFIMSRAL